MSPTKVVKVIIKRILSDMPMVSQVCLGHLKFDHAHFLGNVDEAQHQERSKSCCWNSYISVAPKDLELSDIMLSSFLFLRRIAKGLQVAQEDTA